MEKRALPISITMTTACTALVEMVSFGSIRPMKMVYTCFLATRYHSQSLLSLQAQFSVGYGEDCIMQS